MFKFRVVVDISGLKYNVKLKFSMLTHLTTQTRFLNIATIERFQKFINFQEKVLLVYVCLAYISLGS